MSSTALRVTSMTMVRLVAVGGVGGTQRVDASAATTTHAAAVTVPVAFLVTASTPLVVVLLVIV